ncbi:MAG: FmdB family zinc ribbon protein [Planctomycetota bacterium]
MPTYDYECQACGHCFERFQPISGKHISMCVKCGRKRAKRLIGTGVGLIFKGSGFYITDYKHKGIPNGGAISSDAKDPGKSKDAKTAKDTPARKD